MAEGLLLAEGVPAIDVATLVTGMTAIGWWPAIGVLAIKDVERGRDAWKWSWGGALTRHDARDGEYDGDRRRRGLTGGRTVSRPNKAALGRFRLRDARVAHTAHSYDDDGCSFSIHAGPPRASRELVGFRQSTGAARVIVACSLTDEPE